ncbi:Hypothetical_protein [Hexamita inflata]|uniref:Hypothetical_protein n=1 Tax=Hexamita inflata TaxID=28002 RepID=A0AA86QRM0_9EUKA|nr:Hypothetical protein HINF_LOCUS44421 [Hexamita inflata]CAI9956780.1 Hypothetical protein HINF_LOCUS44425 [Hexamita inflata]
MNSLKNKIILPTPNIKTNEFQQQHEQLNKSKRSEKTAKNFSVYFCLSFSPQYFKIEPKLWAVFVEILRFSLVQFNNNVLSSLVRFRLLINKYFVNYGTCVTESYIVMHRIDQIALVLMITVK